MSKFSCFYSWNPVKFELQKPDGPLFTPSADFKREYPIGWVAIDGDARVVNDLEGNTKPAEEPAVKKSAADNKTADETDPKRSDSKVDTKEDHRILEDEERVNPAIESHGIGFSPDEDAQLEKSEDGETYHVVFSTDCGKSQQWQSYLLFFGAMRVQQSGFVTRIASGCSDSEKAATHEWHQVNDFDCLFFSLKHSHRWIRLFRRNMLPRCLRGFAYSSLPRAPASTRRCRPQSISISRSVLGIGSKITQTSTWMRILGR